ncbi:hypothetical protein [Kutzneria sp. 744]|uniref:hypothetical protein n=1 Tax=Kutzneria sp. (strain 744) TaxID=345341 RepID=UPI0005BCCF1F|nr:hypothetical protein [Kutzneria sp. 744]
METIGCGQPVGLRRPDQYHGHQQHHADPGADDEQHVLVDRSTDHRHCHHCEFGGDQHQNPATAHAEHHAPHRQPCGGPPVVMAQSTFDVAQDASTESTIHHLQPTGR